MFSSAHVDIYRHETVGSELREGLTDVVGVSEPQEVPGRVYKRIHGVCFSFTCTSAPSTDRITLQAMILGLQHISRTTTANVLGQQHIL